MQLEVKDLEIRKTENLISASTVIVLDMSMSMIRSGAFVEAKRVALALDTLMRLSGDEVRLQTRESADWDREFRSRQAKLRNNLGDLQIKRDQLLYTEVDREMFAGGRRPMGRQITSPITYKGFDALQTDIDNLRTALEHSHTTEAFMTAVAPGSFGREQNRYYRSQEEFLYAIADAMRVEYRAIVHAGFVLQIDDPGMAENWDAMDSSTTIEDYREYARLTTAALNHALEGLPEDRVRYHMCWGSWHGPHLTDIPLRDIIDLLMTLHVGAFSVEAGNVRHEHEWKVWREVKLPPGKLLIPGVVSHATNVVEHAELVADRIVQYASLVGRENVIAGTDCGLGGRVHPSLAWAKLRVLSEGAEYASKQLWS